ncbi:hypothetical protein SVIOM342S_03995 [Streptomyces violaceorubidus]
MERYLGGEQVDVKTLIEDLERAVARGVFFPVLAAAPAAEGARQGLGTVELLELITRGFPTPLERAAPRVTTPEGAGRELRMCDPEESWSRRSSIRPPTPTSAGSRWLRRLLRHPARRRDGARVRARDDRPRSRGPRCRRADRRPVHAVRQTAAAGHARDRGRPRLRGQADPRGGCTLGALRSAADGAGDVLTRRCCSPSRRTANPTRTSSPRGWPGWSPRTRRCAWSTTRTPTRWCCGAWARRTPTWPWNGCAAATASRSTSYPTGSPCARMFGGRGLLVWGRHVKQSGGMAQHAIREIEVEPLPGGSGVEFVDKVVGGAVPRQVGHPVRREGRAHAGGRGRRRGPPPLIDVRITLLDGKAHSVGLLRRRVPDRGRAGRRQGGGGEARIDLLEVPVGRGERAGRRRATWAR